MTPSLAPATDPVLEILRADYDRLRSELLSPNGHLTLPERDWRSDQILTLAAEIKRLETCSPGQRIGPGKSGEPSTATTRNVPRTLRVLFASTERGV